ncbi:hypothetical protein LXL04_013201 [Taraxacum kok-saghyz]
MSKMCKRVGIGLDKVPQPIRIQCEWVMGMGQVDQTHPSESDNTCDLLALGKPSHKIPNHTRFCHKVSRGMGRGKVELKRIEDKSSRQVSFSKRRNGLMKKSYELSVLCEVDVALFIFSGKGRLYEFSTDERRKRVGIGLDKVPQPIRIQCEWVMTYGYGSNRPDPVPKYPISHLYKIKIFCTKKPNSKISYIRTPSPTANPTATDLNREF